MASTLANRMKEGAGPSDRYRRLITVNVRHGFYNPPGSEADGPCVDLVIEPTPHTVGRLARLGMLVRRRGDGIEILHNGRREALLGSVAADADGGLSFEKSRELYGPPLLFTIRLANPQFLNITQMEAGFGTGGRALILSNICRGLAGEPAGRTDGGGVDIEIDWSHFVAPATEPEVSPAGAAKEEEAQCGARSGAGPACGWHQPDQANFEDVLERQSIRSDRGGLPFAILEIHIVSPAGEDGRPIPGGFAVDPRRPRSAAKADLDSNGGYVRPVAYDLRFQARQTRWRYVIADCHGRLDGSSLSIVDPGPSAASFAMEADAPPVPGAVRSFAFVSKEALPLRQRPGTRFALRGAALGARRGERPLVDPLPAPDPAMLSRRTSAAGRDGTADLSEIHVFV